MSAHSRGLHREHARPGQPIFLSGRRRHGASTFFLGVAGMARPLSLSLAGRARNTDGTHPRTSSGARSVVSGPFPEVLPPAWRRASSACDRTDPAEQSRSRPRRRWGRRHAAPRNLGRAGRAFVGLRFAGASIEPISSVPTSILSRAVWAGWSSRSPLQDCSAWCARASLSPLDFRLVVKEEPAASSTS